MPSGSSPLTRGKHRTDSCGLPPGRLIPAHAGKTQCSSARLSAWPAHPRSRGENDALSPVCRAARGSSPLTRGKRRIRAAPARPRRLIPAHAGKTWLAFAARASIAAHPRSRGENALMGMIYSPEDGSSPLTRGKRDAFAPGVGDPGLIPAHAGKTSTRRCRRSRASAHPRSRGENFVPRRFQLRQLGSSPLTRGKLTLGSASSSVTGLIPAHAGKTSVWKTAAACLIGSSPLTRGKRRRLPG